MPTSGLQPITGDPLAVAAAARTFDSIAAEITATSARLRSLATGDSHWTGHAANQARTRSITLPPKLDKAQRSYAIAGIALRNYANALDDAQRRSQAAAHVADVATTDLAAARASRQAAATNDAAQASAAAAAGVPRPPQATAPRFDAEISDAESRLANAVRANAAAHEDLRRAARTAASRLHEASHEGIKNQPWWRHVLTSAARCATSTWATSLRVMARVATSVSALAGLAALALSVVGLAFPPLEGAAAVLETISLVSGVVATCADAALAASGNGSWKSVGVDAIALAPWAGSKLVSKLAPAIRRGDVLRPATRVHASQGVGEPPTVATLRTSDSWGAPRRLASHAKRHGPDFGLTSPDQYAAAASAFLQRGLLEGLPAKISARDGVIRMYDRTTNTFGSYNPDGTTRTFYKPDPAEHGLPDNESYWRRQEGRVIKP